METLNRNEILRTELVSLHNDHGKLTPPIVIEAAKPDEHPLHKYFEWDDEKAGYEYRLFQARCLIRSVKITVKTANGNPERHVFHHTKNEEDMPVYHLTDLIIKEPNLLELALNEAKGRLDSAVGSLEELEQVAKESNVSKKRIKKYEKAKELSHQAQKELVSASQ